MLDVELQPFPHHFQYNPFLGKALYKTDADIVHTNSWAGVGFNKSNKKHVCTEHHVVHDKLLTIYKSKGQKVFHKAIYLFEKWAFESATAITTPSNYSKLKVQEYFNTDSMLIYNGIDTNIFRKLNNKDVLDPTNHKKVKLFFVGNLSARKGADLLPKIMNKLGDNFVLYTTVGLQSHMPVADKRIVSIGKVSLDELVKWYNYCDIFLFPSRMEGFGLTVCEAMACGMPVVTSRSTALPEVLEDEKGGYLCELDNVGDFADKITSLADSPLNIKSFSEFNSERVQNEFSMELMAERYIKLYQTL
jgi:glycosyltransferase involved in cell wall biosynthesis